MIINEFDSEEGEGKKRRLMAVREGDTFEESLGWEQWKRSMILMDGERILMNNWRVRSR